MALTGTDVMGKKLVIFDFDGTLANTMGPIMDTARTVMHARGWSDEALGDLRRLVGPPFPQAFSLVFGVSEKEASEITAEYRAIYHNLGLAGWPLFDGVADLLRDLRAHGRVTATASSKGQALLQRALSDNGALDLFDCVEAKRSDEGDEKCQIIARVLDKLGFSAADAVMVGDRRFDVEAAAVHNIPCVGVTYGDTCPVSELTDAGACALAPSVDELRRILLGA